MSWYYNYYLGYKGKDGLYYPAGPYDKDGNLICVLLRSQSFASDLHNDFIMLPSDMMSPELREEFSFKDCDSIIYDTVKYLKFSDLPKGSFIKTGYFLCDDVVQYEKDPYDFDGFYDALSSTVYAEKLKNEAILGPPPKMTDEEGFDITDHSCRDYMYYAYPDYQSREYEAHMIRLALDMVSDFSKSGDYVVLMTEG